MHSQQAASPYGFTSRDGSALTALLILAAVLRLWQLSHTEVAARDSIGYIRIAWRLQHEDIRAVLRSSDQHPLFPAAIAALSHFVRPRLPDDLPLAMQVSSQFVSALASLLLVFPMYFLGRELVGRRPAFGAVVLFQCLPASGEVLGDGLSEPLFFVLLSTSCLAAIAGLRRRSPWPFAAAGLFGALAYLTRPEGGVLVAAAGFVLASTWLVPRWRFPLGRFVASGLALSLAAALVAVPYMTIIGGLTVKPTANNVLHGVTAEKAPSRDIKPEKRVPGATGSPVLFASYAPLTTRDYEWGLRALGQNLVLATFYVGWLPLVLGLWHGRSIFRKDAGPWVILLTALVLVVLLLKVAANMGYLSKRHVLTLFLFGNFWMALGLNVLGSWTARFAVRVAPGWSARRLGQESWWSAVFLGALAVLPLWRTLAPLHADRSGFHQAGEWLAHHVPPGDVVDDAYCWAHYFAGRVFSEGRRDLPHGNPPVHYVVMECSSNKHARLYVHTAEEIQRQGGTVLAHWPVVRGRERAEVRIYAVPGGEPSELGAAQAVPGRPVDDGRE